MTKNAKEEEEKRRVREEQGGRGAFKKKSKGRTRGDEGRLKRKKFD